MTLREQSHQAALGYTDANLVKAMEEKTSAGQALTSIIAVL